MPNAVAVLVGGLVGLTYGIIGLVFATWLHRDENPPAHPIVLMLTLLMWPIPVVILVPLAVFRMLVVVVEGRTE